MKSAYWAILTLISILITSDIKKYHEFCTMFGLKLSIEVPTRVTCSNSTIIDHILQSWTKYMRQTLVFM